jgi:quercetin dioxygenase-like cupin family protein
MRKLRAFLSRLVPILLGVCCAHAWGAEPATKIVLIGGARSHEIGEHDHPNGIILFKQLLQGSPDAHGLIVDAYPDGWPFEATALEGVATVLLYFDGVDSHPLLNPAHRAQFEQLMAKGTGVVALHQASTVPAQDTSIDLPRWLGGARYGMFDSSREAVRFEPTRHPIFNGVGAFLLEDEFYPTFRFPAGEKAITPILTGRVHPQRQEGRPLVIGKGQIRAVAWAYERENGGRSFTFSGLHYLEGLDNPALRKLLLNAIFWTARIDVPRQGVSTSAPADAAHVRLSQETEAANGPKRTIERATVRRSAANQVINYPWGHLTWYVSRELQNSDTLTVGEAVIRPGRENPPHYHPNCDEVLHVLKGHILHSMGNETIEMSSGDTISIPAGIKHNARNIGAEDAVLAISFSSADRQVVGE